MSYPPCSHPQLCNIVLLTYCFPFQVKMVFSPLSTLQPKDWHKTIHVRVCRKWEYRGINEDNPLQHIDLVLVDSQVY